MLRLIVTILVVLLTPPAVSRAEGKPAESRKLTSSGRERTYHLYVPPSLNGAQPAPLLFVFHGAGGNVLSDLGAYTWLADRDGFLLAGPDGSNKRWNAGVDDEIKATNDSDDVAFVRDMITTLSGEFKVDSTRIYTTGFSNGAALCHRLAAEMPDLLAAVAGAGGTMAKATEKRLKPGASIPVMLMIGADDSMFGRKGDLRGGTFLSADETARLWARHNGCSAPENHGKPVPFTRWAAKAPATAEVELWIVEGAGHTPNLSKTFNTAEEQWKFLSRQRLTAAGATFKTWTAWPFSAEEAKQRQSETAAAAKLPVEQSIALSDGVTVKFKLIPAGKFMMGSPESENGHEGDERQREETIAAPFYMMETQLTVAQYRALMKAAPPDGSDPSLPAGIHYRDTVDNVLPALAKLAPAGWKVILPDHPRLEYAARAGIATMNPGGNKPEEAAPFAWSRENSENKVHPVAQKQANAWGLHDVIGNRWHWFWRAGAGYGNDSTVDHIVYGGSYHSESGGNGVRLANIMISKRPEGARFALIRRDSAPPKGHPGPSPATAPAKP